MPYPRGWSRGCRRRSARRAAVCLAFLVAVGLGGCEERPILRRPRNDTTPDKSLSENLRFTGKRYALLVAISQYPPPTHRASGSVPDARDLYGVLLSDYGFEPENIDTLFDRAATRQAIIERFRSLLGRADSEDLVIFYFAGHGTLLPRNYSVQDHEASGNDQALKVWGTDNRGSVILDDELGHLIRGLKTRRALVIVDACFAGTLNYLIPPIPIPKVADPSAGDAEPYVLVASTDPKDPAEDFPAAFISDGDDLMLADPIARWGPDVEPQDHTLLVGTAEDEEGMGWSNWPTRGQDHNMFSYYLIEQLKRRPFGVTPKQLAHDVELAIQTDQKCRGYDCQHPRATGTQSTQPLAQLIGVVKEEARNK
jgi:hypothetical protein